MTNFLGSSDIPQGFLESSFVKEFIAPINTIESPMLATSSLPDSNAQTS